MWTKESMEYRFMADFYNFCKDHYEVRADMDYWNKTVQDATKLCDKYDNNEFCVSLIMGFLDYAERRYNNGKSK